MKTTILSTLLLASLLSLSVQAQEQAAPADSASPAASLVPKIVCPEPIFEFGEKSNTEFVEHDYMIRNEGQVSLEITGVRASCGCTAVKPSQDVIPPGGEASIRARLDLRGRKGMQRKNITVNSNDPKTPSLVLQLKGVAIAPLSANPGTLFFGRLNKNSVRSRPFDVVSGKGPIQIISTRTDNPGLILTPVAAEPDADGTTHRFELALDPALPEGNANGSVFIKTDMEGQPELAIRVAAYIVEPLVPAGEPEAAPEVAAEAAPEATPEPAPVPTP